MDKGKRESKNEDQPMDVESGTVDPRDLVSSDDEIDYSIKPELYDPNLDEVDELWVRKQRKGGSDAVLSCPACFTTLCLDCQRHEKYVTQYRAMFVRNCTVKTDQILREGNQKPKQKRKKNSKKAHLEEDSQTEGPIYRPVCCSVCSTEVGVLDQDEIYHFFNVIPSN
ncbi:hypothetical protein LUZ60_016655 [Juncus effusus]|nr:hypothetical protein LUZ60_016655 [Juncus effusus]